MSERVLSGVRDSSGESKSRFSTPAMKDLQCREGTLPTAARAQDTARQISTIL
jgi:hypothetical protein